jgi:hypothetical protein
MWVQRQLNVTIKSKVVPVLNHEDVWWSRGTAPPFLTSALVKVSGQLHALAALSPRLKSHRYTFDMKLGGPQEPIWTLWWSENVLPCRASTFGPSVVQPVASLYIDWFTASQAFYRCSDEFLEFIISAGHQVITRGFLKREVFGYCLHLVE